MKIMPEKKKNIDALSAREYEIIELIAKGLSNKEIAELLCLSVHTVMTHTKNIFKKLNVKSRYEAAYEHLTRTH
ncbi:response regulator transcription factor [Flocculibacter collagenilyticus]|uniref:response regulator transcription factor n=1 Tax=Flocculibacter collagenilyticus TaxID=2744479 RepID=UPI0018F35F09|nr:LuxR C-terminal-related transcriptional regulator [Flocculibacter collagenilyticus]